jgi:hypothetical protein
MAYTFTVSKVGRSGNVIATSTVTDAGYSQAAKQVTRKNGYKLAGLKVVRVDAPSVEMQYTVREGRVRYFARSI